ncbi:M28 family peptidase [Longimicrobium terrae]|uniref:Peptidase M28 domain-containing protein n=1 Tax=Longimicrobium terrae TaxID=1639882 RepID=A0A841H116_9BACT|nr:M28 family peptidase [Longimicrobium terrae]MBB4637387.1 hypothetical protein [Longimicrobium terrae]MBB6071785.1 hypothetical protein [Longimicrobium terrae]NNC28545.1 M28 family peptidase [Longimicrobium terrae]
MRIRSRHLLPLALLSAASLHAQADVRRAAEGIREPSLRARVEWLAGDAMRGRATPGAELEAAADSIAAIFRRAGLRAAGDSGSYIQRFAFYATCVPASERRFAMQADGRRTEWRYGADYFSFAASTAVEGEAVYVGPALPQPQPLSEGARGRIAVFHLAGSPVDGFPVMSGAVLSAVRAGATGLLFVLDPAMDADSIAWFAQQVEATNPLVSIPVSVIRADAADSIFRAAGLDDGALRARSSTTPLPLPGVQLSMAAPARTVSVAAQNVVAVLPGSDPARRDEYVVLTAHFARAGVGRADARGDSIYNGADDSASGTAALLAAAEAFGRLRMAPARSIVFLAVSGEERNLRGSAHWAAHPTVAGGRVVANINLDMRGRNAPGTLTVLGQEYSSLGETVARANAAHPELGFQLPSDVDDALHGFARGDHASFVRAGVPALFLTALDRPDDHHVTDDPMRLNTEKLTRVARLLFYTVHAAASEPALIGWYAGGQARALEAATR